MEQNYDLNGILLSDKYEAVKESIKEEIIMDLASKRVSYSNTEEFAVNDFLKDQLVDMFVDDQPYEVTYGNLLTLLIMAKPFNYYKVPFPESILFDPSDLSEYGVYYTKLLEHFEYSAEVKSQIKDVISELAIVSGDINVTFGNTVSIKSLIDLSKNVERFRELLHYKLPKDKNFEFNEIEAIIRDNLAEIMEILSTTDNQLRHYIKSGAGINAKQFGQVLSLVGSKPDLFGNIIPYPINTSFMRGLDVRSFYINSLGARKALITNHQQVRNSGYLTRKLSMLLMDTKLVDIEDCGSHESNYARIHVDSKDTLKRFNRRYYSENGVLKLIDIEDESLIGETIAVPTPVTCASNEGICRKCYGTLFDINKDLNIGMISVLILTDPLTQRLLSAKHLLETRSSKINWGIKFEENFVVNRNLVFPKSYSDTLILKEDDYVEDGESEDQVFRNFTVKSGNRHVAIESPMSFFLNKAFTPKIMEGFYNMEENQYEIQFDKVIEEGDSFAFFVMENNELSQPLLKIKNLIETNSFIKDHEVNETVNYFIYLLNEAGIGIQSVHMELIVREMMRLEDTDREQFQEDTMPEYEMLRITDANLKGESLSRALLFEQVKKQLTTMDYGTFEKTKPSILDQLL
jgi:RNA polymerase Rpb1, domain 5